MRADHVIIHEQPLFHVFIVENSSGKNWKRGNLAVSLADESDAGAAEAGLPGSAAVLITGSVATAGDAQLLLAPASAVGRSANPRARRPSLAARSLTPSRPPRARFDAPPDFDRRTVSHPTHDGDNGIRLPS